MKSSLVIDFIGEAIDNSMSSVRKEIWLKSRLESNDKEIIDMGLSWNLIWESQFQVTVKDKNTTLD